MVEAVNIPLKLVYRGGNAAKNRLDLYDGTQSLFGFAKALQIVTHAFVKNSVLNKSTALKGAELYVLPSKSGSVLQPLLAHITDPVFLSGLGAGVLTNAFYDFIKYSVGKAVGMAFNPETATLARRVSKDDLFFDELADILEGPLTEAHRTIEFGGGTVSLERPRSALLTFDRETLDWVKTRDLSDDFSDRLGTVTRFNVLSKNGRLFDQEEKRTIPFKPAETLDGGSIKLLSKSLD